MNALTEGGGALFEAPPARCHVVLVLGHVAQLDTRVGDVLGDCHIKGIGLMGV